MGIFDKIKEWFNSFKKEKVEEIIDVGIDKNDEDYEAHVYLKQKYGYNKKARRAIIRKWRKHGGEL